MSYGKYKLEREAIRHIRNIYPDMSAHRLATTISAVLVEAKKHNTGRPLWSTIAPECDRLGIPGAKHDLVRIATECRKYTGTPPFYTIYSRIRRYDAKRAAARGGRTVDRPDLATAC